MNEENRNFDNTDKFWPTCQATIYQLTLFNRQGREIWNSEYDNHPWDGKLRNGKQCKDGTYFYKIEYILNPHLSDYEQNQTQYREKIHSERKLSFSVYFPIARSRLRAY